MWISAQDTDVDRDKLISLAARPAAWWACFAAALAVLLAPLAIAEVPPLTDYPNHLARAYVLAFGQEDAHLSQFYGQRWAVIPNLAVDLLLPALLKVMPVHLAGRAVLGLILLLNYAAIIVYSRVAFGRRSYWPLAAALMAYNALFLMGFMNFLIGQGFALLAAAAWAAHRDRHPVLTVAGTALAATGVFFCHIFGLVFLAILVGSRELTTVCQRWRQEERPVRLAASRGAAAGAVFLPSAALYLRAPLSETGGEVLWLTVYWKVKNLTEPFMNYHGIPDKLTTAAVLGFLAACLWRRALRVHAASAVAVAACLLLYGAAPYAMKEGAYVDSRFPIMIGALLFAGFLPALSRRAGSVVALAVAALFLARMAMLAAAWWGHDREIADIRETMAPVEPGSRVLVATVDPQVNPAYWAGRGRRSVVADFSRTDLHLGALLTIERHAFWPHLFTLASQQPLVVLPPFDKLSAPGAVAPDYHLLDPDADPARYGRRSPHLAGWTAKFDYVLLLNAGGADGMSAFLADRLEPLTGNRTAALYRVRPDPAERLAVPR